MTEQVKVLRKNQIYADIQRVFTIVRFKWTMPNRETYVVKGGQRDERDSVILVNLYGNPENYIERQGR